MKTQPEQPTVKPARKRRIVVRLDELPPAERQVVVALIAAARL